MAWKRHCKSQYEYHFFGLYITLIIWYKHCRCLLKLQKTRHISPLSHWDRVTYICVSKLAIIGSDNGLSPGRRQAIIWNNAGLLSIGLLGTNFNQILIKIHKFSFKKMRLKVSSAKWRPICFGLNVLIITFSTRICMEGCCLLRAVQYRWNGSQLPKTQHFGQLHIIIYFVGRSLLDGINSTKRR